MSTHTVSQELLLALALVFALAFSLSLFLFLAVALAFASSLAPLSIAHLLHLMQLRKVLAFVLAFVFAFALTLSLPLPLLSRAAAPPLIGALHAVVCSEAGT